MPETDETTLIYYRDLGAYNDRKQEAFQDDNKSFGFLTGLDFLADGGADFEHAITVTGKSPPSCTVTR